jgi:hypothetical protein
MNKILHIVSILSIIVISFNTMQGQTSELEDSSLNSTEFRFPPLQVVLDSVLKRSAMLKFRNKHIGVVESTLASERIYWSRNLGVQADTRYGNLSNFATSEDGSNNTASLTTATQFNYTVGVYIRFPLFDVLNRKNQIELAELEIDEATSMAEFTKEEIRQTVIRMYQNLILKQKLLKIRSRSFSDGSLNKQMVEKEFKNGVVPLSEYVRISGITSNLESDYEEAMSEFITAKQLLEDMAGFIFGLTNLKR